MVGGSKNFWRSDRGGHKNNESFIGGVKEILQRVYISAESFNL